jgi:nucleoside-diphosphate-sugar epimerase
MKVLVTGATGFLGSRLASTLALRGDAVRVLYRGTGGGSRLQTTKIEIARGDLKDRESLRKAIAGVDVVCHVAAAMSGSWREYTETTIQGTEWMLKLSQEAGVKRFVHISSITVYRTWNCGKEAVIDETCPWDPEPERLGPYAYSKIEAEKYAFQYLRQGLPVVVIRPGIIYGPGGRVIHPNVGYFMTKRLFLLVGTGDNPLPLTYVDNTVDGILLAISNDKAVGQAYNLVDGAAITQKEFLYRYRSAVDDRFATLSLPLPILLTGAIFARQLKRLGMTSIVTTAYGLRAQYAKVRFDAAKARRELGWQPRITLEEGLRRTFAGSPSAPFKPL